jgi:hypothetical protein
VCAPPFNSDYENVSSNAQEEPVDILSLDEPVESIPEKSPVTYEEKINDLKEYSKYKITPTCTSNESMLGLPVHTVVNFVDKPGVMVVSSLHMCELTGVKADISNVILNATKVLGRERSDEINKEFQEILKLGNPLMLRRATSSAVSEIATNSTFRKVKKLKRSST